MLKSGKQFKVINYISSLDPVGNSAEPPTPHSLKVRSTSRGSSDLSIIILYYYYDGLLNNQPVGYGKSNLDGLNPVVTYYISSPNSLSKGPWFYGAIPG